MITDENAKILIKALCEYIDEVKDKKPKVVEILTGKEAIRPYGSGWEPGYNISQRGYEEFHMIEGWEGIFD